MQPQLDVYDAVAYPTFAYPDTHPSRLATMATLHGLHPTPIERCRVLEIGCNAAANLIPMAYALPGSEFVGFDLAGLPVARGQQRLQALGLTNIRILQADLMEAGEIPELAGPFDYIIAHGLYTWVPSAVRDRLLSFCKERLSPQGVAFISYAALPGGHMRLLVRDVLQYRETQPNDAAANVRDSFEFLRFIASSRPVGDGFRTLLERELEIMEKRGPEAVFHDELSSAYRPVLFSQFTGHAAQHGLRYFSEAEIPGPVDPEFQSEIAMKLQELSGGDPMVKEQILDFSRMRMYRESLLCHADAGFTHDLQPDMLRRLAITSHATAAEGRAAGARVYTSPIGTRIETQHPATLALLEYLLARYPEAVTFSQLSAHVEAQGIVADADLPVILLRLLIARIVDLHAWAPPVARLPAERPWASPVCREQALAGTQVVTLLHTTLSVADAIVRQLVLLLDGTRDREALRRDLARALPEVPAETLEQGIDSALELLAQTGVLERRQE